jgi:hypothetical protein
MSEIQEIVGNTMTTPVPQSDWNEPDRKKASYIKNKPKVHTEEEIINLIDDYGGGPQIQADWEQKDTTAKDYIQNKPTLGSLAAKDEIDKSDLSEEVQSALENAEYAAQKLKRHRIEKVILHYGEPAFICDVSSVNDAVNIYKNYDIVIFGDQYQIPEPESNPYYDNTVSLIQKIHEDYSSIRIVGYVPIGMHPDWEDSCLLMTELKERVDQWFNIGANGIFLDEFGYDYFVTRDRQNEIVDYCHEKGLFVFANSWSLEYCFNPDPMKIEWLGDFEANPNGYASSLNKNDYYLFEHLFFNVSDENPIECGDVWRFNDLCRYYTDPRIEGKSFSEYYGTKLCSLDGIHSTLSLEEKNKLKTISTIGSAILNIDAVAFGDEHWGSDGNFEQWEIPDFDIMNSSYNTVLTETKSVTLEDGTQEDFPYKWTTSVNGRTYSLIWDIPYIDYDTWEDGKRYISIDGVVIENAWLSIFNFQSEIAKADVKIQEGLSVIDSGVSQISEALNKIDQKASEIDSEIGKIDEALVGVQDVVKGFAFREVQW